MRRGLRWCSGLGEGFRMRIKRMGRWIMFRRLISSWLVISHILLRWSWATCRWSITWSNVRVFGQRSSWSELVNRGARFMCIIRVCSFLLICSTFLSTFGAHDLLPHPPYWTCLTPLCVSSVMRSPDMISPLFGLSLRMPSNHCLHSLHRYLGLRAS